MREKKYYATPVSSMLICGRHRMGRLTTFGELKDFL
jgi:hypothetical protein